MEQVALLQQRSLTHHQTGRQAHAFVRDVQLSPLDRCPAACCVMFARRTGQRPGRPHHVHAPCARRQQRARAHGPGDRDGSPIESPTPAAYLSLARSSGSGHRPVRSRRRRACMPARHAARPAGRRLCVSMALYTNRPARGDACMAIGFFPITGTAPATLHYTTLAVCVASTGQCCCLCLL